jgi:pimeloyl-ACP methyl ester carboxylesterase
MFTKRDRFRKSIGPLAILVGCGLLGALTAAPAQAQAQRPLLLIGGTFTTTTALNEVAKPWFTQNGYADNYVYTLQLATDNTLVSDAEQLIDEFAVEAGINPRYVSAAGTASIDEDANDPSSGMAIRAKVDAILAEHPEADKVDIIGHSQGAVAARWYVKDAFQDGEEKVGTLISLGGAERGVQPSGPLENLFWTFACFGGTELGVVDVCQDMILEDGAPTPFLFWLNLPDATPGNARYHHLYGDDDAVETGTLGFVSEHVPGALHVEEWENADMRLRMLDIL